METKHKYRLRDSVTGKVRIVTIRVRNCTTPGYTNCFMGYYRHDGGVPMYTREQAADDALMFVQKETESIEN